MNKLTLVTGFYEFDEIKSRKEKTIEKYFEHAEHLFKTEINIVFFIQQKYYYKIWQARKKYNLLDKTLIIIREKNELKFMDQIDKGKECLKKNPIRHTVIENNTPVYYYFMYNKVYLVEEIIKLNPFNSEYFGWIDFGINHVMKGFKIETLLENPPVKVKMCQIKNISEREIKNLHGVGRTCIARTVGGLWVGNKIMINLFIEQVKKWIDRFFTLGMITHDENIYGVIMTKNSDIMDIVYGDYQNFCYNWNKITSFNHVYIANMKHCRWSNTHEQVIDMFNKLKEICWNKMQNTNKFDVYSEVIISSFYIDKKMYDRIILEFVKFIEDNKDDKKIIMKLKKNEGGIKNNVNFGSQNIKERIEKLIAL